MMYFVVICRGRCRIFESTRSGADTKFGTHPISSHLAAVIRCNFELYRYTAEALRAVDRGLKVGGPSRADNAWITEFVEFCATQHVPADFISTPLPDGRIRSAGR